MKSQVLQKYGRQLTATMCDASAGRAGGNAAVPAQIYHCLMIYFGMGVTLSFCAWHFPANDIFLIECIVVSASQGEDPVECGGLEIVIDKKERVQ